MTGEYTEMVGVSSNQCFLRLSFNLDLSNLLLEDAQCIPFLQGVDDAIFQLASVTPLEPYDNPLGVAVPR